MRRFVGLVLLALGSSVLLGGCFLATPTRGAVSLVLRHYDPNRSSDRRSETVLLTTSSQPVRISGC